MIDNDAFRKFAHEVADWMADYYKNIETSIYFSTSVVGQCLLEK